MQRIDYFKWLSTTMPRWYTSMGGNHRTPTIQENDNLFRDTIKTRSRYHDGSSGSGKESPVQMTYERTAIKGCLLELESYIWLSDSRFVMVQNPTTSMEST